MSFDEIPEDVHEGYPCDCGGSITKYDGKWRCDTCDFEAPDAKKKEMQHETEIPDNRLLR